MSTRVISFLKVLWSSRISGMRTLFDHTQHALNTRCRAILNDPALYPEPEKFIPERHLGENPQPDPRKYAFGFSRRVCPGMNLRLKPKAFFTLTVWTSRCPLCGDFVDLHHFVGLVGFDYLEEKGRQRQGD